MLEIEKYAYENSIPIMQKDGIEFLTKFICENNIKKILEIGTAIGYSAIKMCLASTDVTVTTIERDKARYDMALENIKKFNLEDRITCIYGDALDIAITGSYDLIFIDAAKGQYTKFFEKFKYFLAPNGIIVTDNLKFHGYVGSTKPIENRNLRGIVTKIEKYINFLKDNEEFETKFYDVGDGLSVSVKKQDK